MSKTTAKTAETIEFPTFDATQATDQMRAMAEKGVEQTKEAYAKMKDGAETTLTCNYIPEHATHDRATGLRGKIGEVLDFQLIAPGEAEIHNFSALVMGVTRSFPVQGVMQLSITIKQTGAESFTPAP